MKLRRLARSQRSVIQDDDENLSTNSEDPVVLDLSNIRRTTRQLNHRVINEEPLERDSRKRRTRYSKKTTTTGRTNQQRWKKTLSNTMSSSSDAFDSCSSCEDSTSSSSSSEETRQSSSEDQEVSWNTSSSTCVVRTKRRLEDFEDGEHVTIWNCVERRKIAGNAAPLAKNLKRYFEKHPECEIYAGQDLEEDTETRVAELKSNMAVSQSHGGGVGGGHVSIWNRVEKRKIAGNAAPLWKNLENYLLKHPECEVYNGQDKEILERRRQKKFSMTKESKRKSRVSGATRSSKHVDACDTSVKEEEPWSSSNNAVITNLDQPTTTEERKDIVIVKDSVEEEMTLFVDSVFSDHTKDLANFISWNDELCMEEVFLLDKGTKASKGDDDAALELSEEELSLLNDDLDVLVDFSASNCFSSSFCMTSGEGVSL